MKRGRKGLLQTYEMKNVHCRHCISLSSGLFNFQICTWVYFQNFILKLKVLYFTDMRHVQTSIRDHIDKSDCIF